MPVIVARIEAEVPLGRPTLVRATLPVPPSFEPAPAPGHSALAMQTPEGELVPCQLEVVTRGPKGQVEVVEVLAPVTVPRSHDSGGETTSARITFPLLRGSFALPTDTALDARVRAWLGAGPAAINARDVLGNLYVGDLLRPGAGRLTADGPYVRRIDAFAVMRPVAAGIAPGDPTGAQGEPVGVLPHLLGLHGHFTLVAGDPRVALDLRVHAGLTSGAAPDTPDEAPVGGVWFDELALEVPASFTVDNLFPDAALGGETVDAGRSRRALVARQLRNHVHFMPPSAQFQRRLVLRPRDAEGGHPAFEGLGFAVEGDGLWSWSSPVTPRYFPQRVALPTWSALDGGRQGGLVGLRARLAARSEALRDVARAGGADGRKVHAAAMGWSHPWFYAHQGVAGGEDIAFVEGHVAIAARSTPEVLRLALAHQLNISRHPVAMWRADGSPAGLDSWRDAEGGVPFDFRTNAWMQPPELKLPARGGAAPAAHLAEVLRQDRRPDYDLGAPFERWSELPSVPTALLAWMPHDGQHLVRITKDPKALVWLTNDRLAAEDLRLEAERFRLMVHDARPADVDGVTLTHLEHLARRRPHTGLPINRDHAWGLDAVVAAYAVSDDAWRARFRPWLERFVDVYLAGAMPNGLVMREHYGQLLEGRYDGAHTFQVLFLQHALRALVEGVFRDADEERARQLEVVFFRGLEYLYFGPPFQRVEDKWSKGQFVAGPAAQFAVAPRGPDGKESSELPYCYAERWGAGFLPKDGLTLDAVERTYSYEVLGYADDWARRAGRPDAARWLERALDLWTGFPRHEAVLQRMRLEDDGNDLSGSGSRAAYLARVQRGASK